ncbi:MAG: hypothetical protein IKC58_05810 [Clostridia bacterium]|nr:hypothetical protein [Clostridia bacterium]
MSKNTKTVKNPATWDKRAIWITAVVVAVVVIAIIIVASIFGNTTINPDNDGSNSGGSSSLTISNGDFLYTQSESTSLPYEAQDWVKKTYNDGKTFGDIEDEQKVVMGIVNTNESVWADVESALAAKGLDVSNPLTHSDKGVIDQVAVEEDEVDIANVYMIATKEATNASILSNSFSIPSLTSVKITVWMNAEQLGAGSIASAMVQRSSSTISSEKNGNTQYWFAYDLEIEKEVTSGTNGWQKVEFFVFNRSSNSTSVRLNVGIGNVYGNVASSGVLFIDDIQYETVTANEYRKHFDATNNLSYIIEAKDQKDSVVTNYNWSNASELKVGTKTGVDAYLDTDAAKVKGEVYSPFVSTDKFALYQVNSTSKLTQNISLTGADGEDNYLHLYFWMRVVEQDQYPQASIADITLRDTSAPADKNLSKLANIAAVKDITEDNNCGWKQYHIYVKPDQDVTDAEVALTIEWAKTGLAHDGQMFVSALMCEVISDTDYAKATSNATTNIKADMSKTHANTGVTNGTFGYLEDTNKTQPENWTPVFAGSNDIYQDGKGDETINGVVTTKDAIDNKIMKVGAPSFDDAYGYYLAVTNKQATAQGFLSQSISLSAKSVYRISVLAKVEGNANPYIYLVNKALAQAEEGTHADAIIGKFESVATNSDMDKLLMQPVQEGNGWVRYYFIVETADAGVTVNVALFNGSIDGATLATGTVYYDQVTVEQLGSYTIGEDTENEDATLYQVKYSAKSGSGYADLFETHFANVDGKTATMNTIEFNFDNAQVVRLADAEKWEEMRTIPEEEEEVEDDDDHDHDHDHDHDFEWGLFASVASSIVLVVGLGAAIIVKLLRKKR